jgi:hypothetical protein
MILTIIVPAASPSAAGAPVEVVLIGPQRIAPIG